MPFITQYIRPWGRTAAAFLCGALLTYGVMRPTHNGLTQSSNRTTVVTPTEKQAPLLATVASDTTPVIADDGPDDRHAQQRYVDVPNDDSQPSYAVVNLALAATEQTNLPDTLQLPRKGSQNEVASLPPTTPESSRDWLVARDVAPKPFELNRSDFTDDEEYELAKFSQRRSLIPQPASLEPAEYTNKLQEVRELGIDKLPYQDATNKILHMSAKTQHPLEQIIQSRTDLKGLPFQMGKACISDVERVAHLSELGPLLKRLPGNWPGNELAAYLTNVKLMAPNDGNSAVPAIAQIMQSEAQEGRMQIVEFCKACDNRESVQVLAKRALFDQSRSIRSEAIDALKLKDRELYQQELLEALRYPFQPVVQNAAVAVAELNLTEAVPLLRAMLEEPDPNMPQFGEQDSSQKYVRELVRINHFANCTLCHAPSAHEGDPLRGFTPKYGEEIPPAYYATSPGSSRAIRADITYLRQDFSIKYTILDESNWPDQKRFDFVVRVRRATSDELGADAAASNELSDFKKPLLFALRRLNDIDYGNSVEAWKVNMAADTRLVRNTIKLPVTLVGNNRSANQLFMSAHPFNSTSLPAKAPRHNRATKTN